MLHGFNDFLFILKRKEAVYIVPEPKKATSKEYIKITKYNDKVLIPYDIQYDGNNLYVLDFYNGVYVFEITGSERPK